MADVAKLPTIADQPVDSKEENFADESKDVRSVQSPQSHSTNSHHHDSEYDTASDLEGVDDDDDYNDDDDDDDESLGADGEEDDIESENGSVVFDLERQRGDGQETDYAKKVDEDRSNPQYIPKRGTFYEHDDRTVDDPEANVDVEDGGEGDTTKCSTPTISATSKTMKKWQAASAMDRWSHDRYDESEQAPKSRSELVSAYGYDIRNEDGPPRARRRRRYGRGPSKYVRNWEDESAYIKPVIPQRKPRPEDFPALGDRKGRKSRSFREEKENRYDKYNDRASGSQRGGGNNSQRDGKGERRNSGKSFRSNRQSVEFKNQNKNRMTNDMQNRIPQNRQAERVENTRHIEDTKSQVESVSFTNTKAVSNNQNERYNNHDMAHMNQMANHRELKEKLPSLNASNVMNSRSTVPPTSQIASRLQIQARNDPSHVGSVQMHSLVTTNQPDLQLSESGRTKRYSSLRQRTQNDAIVVSQPSQIDHHSLQQQIQLHEHQQQQQQQQQQQAQHVLLQEQHLLQANLMQLYHTQENLQAQIQGVTLQSLPANHQSKPQYQNVQPQYQAASPQAAPAYYAQTNEYAAPPPAPASQPQYTQQQPATYLQQQPAAPQIAAYSAQSPPPVPPQNQPMSTALNYVQTPQNPNPSAPYQNFSGYQNFNTVGGTTYFVPQHQPTPRPVVLPQKRPTNAIPILAPPTDKTKQKSQSEKDDDKSASTTTTANAPIGSAENIDHILDNMFVQRPPLQPPTRKSSSPATESVGTSTVTEEKSAGNQSAAAAIDNSGQMRLEEAVKSLSINDDTKLLATVEPQQQQLNLPPVSNAASPPEITEKETG